MLDNKNEMKSKWLIMILIDFHLFGEPYAP